MENKIRTLAELAKISLTEEEIRGYAASFPAIIAMADSLPQIDASGSLLDPDNTMPLRADEIQPSADRDVLLQNAAKSFGGCFVAPKTVE